MLSPGNKETNSWQHVFACWTCDRNHGYDLGDGNPLQSPGCEVRTEIITMKQKDETCQNLSGILRLMMKYARLYENTRKWERHVKLIAFLNAFVHL